MEKTISTIFKSEDEISTKADRFYKNYWTNSDNISELSLKKKYKILNAFFPDGISNKSVLEIGVGGEGGLIVVLKTNNKVEGIDVSESAIENCKQFGMDVKYLNCDTSLLPFESNSFDIVFAFEVFEHFSNPQFVIEEIKRVLKDKGTLLISTPTPLTNHWPRLFYPSVFEKKNFYEFLSVNGFDVKFSKDILLVNNYFRTDIPEVNKSFSWYWFGEKISSNDSMKFYEIGKYFFEQKDEFDFRTRPIEAIDLFRRSYSSDPHNPKAKLGLTHALLYRFIQGEMGEFSSFFSELVNDFSKVSTENYPEYIYTILIIDLEAKIFNIFLLPEELKTKLYTALEKLPETSKYIEILKEFKRKHKV